jgi:hypothetical protein
MKKILTTMFVAVIALTASAQVYVGAGMKAWRDADANKTTLGLSPEVGYHLSDKVALGIALDYQYVYNAGSKTNSFAVAPYMRYTFAKLGNINLFADATAGVASSKTKGRDSETCWQAGIRPGLSVGLTDKLSFIAHAGFLGYRDADENGYFGDNGFGADISSSDLMFGLYYNF